MKKLLGWWYALSLPQRPLPSTPVERERERYTHLTAGLLLVLISAIFPLLPIMLFFSPASPSARPDAIGMLCLLTLSWVFNRLGLQKSSATCIIAVTYLSVTGPLLTDPLSAALVPLFNVFTISIILAGALLPPIAALITGLVSCLYIVLIGMVSLNIHTYNQGSQIHYQTVNTLAIAIILPIVIQIIVACIVYGIMRNLVAAIRRADRAEEIVALQTAIVEHERKRMYERKLLEDGLEKIAAAHARIANGDYQARISLNEGHVLWSIAVPLNNLLNRLQAWKGDADTLLATRHAAAYVVEQLRQKSLSGQRYSLPLTRTLLDPIIVEVNRIMG